MLRQAKAVPRPPRLIENVHKICGTGTDVVRVELSIDLVEFRMARTGMRRSVCISPVLTDSGVLRDHAELRHHKARNKPMRIQHVSPAVICLICAVALGCSATGRQDVDRFASGLELKKVVANALRDVSYEYAGGHESAGVAVDVYVLSTLWTIHSDKGIGMPLLEHVADAAEARLNAHGGHVSGTIPILQILHTEPERGKAPDLIGLRILYKYGRARGVVDCRLLVTGTGPSTAYLEVEHLQFR